MFLMLRMGEIAQVCYFDGCTFYFEIVKNEIET